MKILQEIVLCFIILGISSVPADVMASIPAPINAYSYQATADKIIARWRSSPHKMLFELYKEATQYFNRKKLQRACLVGLQKEATPAMLGKDPNGYLLWLPLNEAKPLRVGGDEFTMWLGVYRTMPEGVVWKVECALVSASFEIPVARKYDAQDIQSALHPIWKGALRLRRIQQLLRENGIPTDLLVVAGNMHPIDNVEEAFGFRIDIRFRNRSNLSLTAYSGIKRKGSLHSLTLDKDILLPILDYPTCCGKGTSDAANEPLCKYFECDK